jgi:hypothetical protein
LTQSLEDSLSTKLRRPRLTYANVVATLALFLALGGVSYAATTLPKSSVGSEQIRAEAVRTGKVADDAVTGVKLAQGVRERLSPVGGTPAVTTTTSTPESVEHAETADRAATAGSATTAAYADSAEDAATADLATTFKDADALGGQPADQYMTADSVLRPGQTEAGDFIASASTNLAGTVLVQFWPHLPESLPEGHIIVLPEGSPGTVQCPGAGQRRLATCVYQSFNEGMTFESFISTMPGSIYAGPVSGVMTWRSGQFNGLLRGTWAYTAP